MVHDPFSAAWFSLEGDTLRTLFAPDGNGAYSIEEYRQKLSDYLVEAEAIPYDPADPQAGGGGYLVDRATRGFDTRWLIGGLALTGACAIGLVLIRKTPVESRPTTDG